MDQVLLVCSKVRGSKPSFPDSVASHLDCNRILRAVNSSALDVTSKVARSIVTTEKGVEVTTFIILITYHFSKFI